MKFEGSNDLSLKEAMARVRDLFVNHYADPAAWAFAVWLTLTENASRRNWKRMHPSNGRWACLCGVLAAHGRSYVVLSRQDESQTAHCLQSLGR
jgi:hypothetical protein